MGSHPHGSFRVWGARACFCLNLGINMLISTLMSEFRLFLSSLPSFYFQSRQQPRRKMIDDFPSGSNLSNPHLSVEGRHSMSSSPTAAHYSAGRSMLDSQAAPGTRRLASRLLPSLDPVSSSSPATTDRSADPIAASCSKSHHGPSANARPSKKADQYRDG